MSEYLPCTTVTILNYNGKKYLERFLPAVLAINYPNKKIMVLDGGSTDGSLEFLSKFPNVRVVDQGKTTGVAHAMNVAAKSADTELVMFLASDMSPHSELLSKLVRRLVSDPRVAVCGPKVLAALEDGTFSDIIDHVGFDVDKYGFPNPRGFGERDRGQYDKLTTSSFFGSTEMLVRRSVIAEVGFFDPTYITLSEDIDFCWRVKEFGYEVALEPNGIVYHALPLVHTSLSERFTRGKIRYFAERNTQRTIIKNYSIGTLARIVPVYLGILVAEVWLFAALRRIDMLKADLNATAENLRNLKQIWKQHIWVQAHRTVPDDKLLLTLNRRSFKFSILEAVLEHLRA